MVTERKGYYPWTPEHEALIRREYARLGPFVMHRDYFPYRSYASVVSKARHLGVSYVEQKPKVALDAWPVPTHGLLEQLDCIRLRKWGGAQPDARFGVPSIGAVA